MEFVLRHISDDMHRAWKSTAALKGLTMRDYCIIALKTQIQLDLNKLQKEKKDVS